MERIIGYLKVSSFDQDVEKSKNDILQLVHKKGIAGEVEWIVDKVSGTRDWRTRKLGGILKELKIGDTIIVSELSRLGRSTLQILEIMKIAQKKGITIHAVKGGWSIDGKVESKFVLQMLAIFSEIERDIISERTKEGLRARRAAGIRLGRPKGPGKSKLDEHKDEIISLLENGATKTFIARRFSCTTPNLYNWLKKNKIPY